MHYGKAAAEQGRRDKPVAPFGGLTKEVAGFGPDLIFQLDLRPPSSFVINSVDKLVGKVLMSWGGLFTSRRYR